MKTIYQHGPSCSLAALCTLNGCTQADYEALLDLLKERGKSYRGRSKLLRDAIGEANSMMAELGYFVPCSYARTTWCEFRNAPQYTNQEALAGKGIVWISGRKTFQHTVAFEDGKLFDSNRYKWEIENQPWETWDELCARYRKIHPRTPLKIFKIYKQD